MFLCILKSQPEAAAKSLLVSLFSVSERAESPDCSTKVDSGLKFLSTAAETYKLFLIPYVMYTVHTLFPLAEAVLQRPGVGWKENV